MTTAEFDEGAGKQQPSRKSTGNPAQDKIVNEHPYAQDSLASVVTRNEYYRDGFRRVIKLAAIEAISIAGLILALIVTISVNQPQDRYFATTADGRLVPMLALDQPNLGRAALMSWVAQAATEVMTFGFHDYQRRLQEASRHFTRRGWESFTTALQQSRIIEAVEQQQQVLTSAPKSAPVLVSEGVFEGKYRWVVELPLLVTYKAGNKTRADSMLVTIVVERVPTLDSPNGVGIDQWIAR